LNLEVFCYVGLLRFPEQLGPSLALLPDGERAEATSFLATVKDLPKRELLQRWSRLREDDYAAMRRNVYERTGIRLDELAPALRDWCISWLADQNG
jgi:hypothetical protein